jgi:hypothetical protein
LRDKTPKFDKFTQGLDQLVMKVSLDKEISKKQMKKIMGREGERERVRASWCAKMEESKIFNWLRIEVQFITR